MQPLDLPPGRVISVRGSVVDVRFAPPLPTRYRELRTGPEGEIVLEVASLLAEYEELKDIIAMLGEEELSRQDRATVSKARRLERFLTQPFFTTEHFTGHPGKLVSLEQTIAGCERILAGELSEVDEQALYMKGAMDE
jgi:F-type H+-transporting ATPase subunit beta